MTPIPVRAARSRGPAALLTGVVSVAALLALGVPALAADDRAPVISSVSVDPGAVVLGKGKSGSVTFTVSAKIKDSGGIDRVVAGLYGTGGREGRAVVLTRSAGNARNGTWTGRASVPNSAKGGTWSVRAMATDTSNNSSDPDKVYTTFAVQDRTRVTKADVAPEPAEKGSRLQVAASLQRWKPGTGWVGFGDERVLIEFRPSDDEEFEEVRSARTSASGALETTVPAVESGRWQLRFAGDSGHAPSTARDHVEVM